MAQPAAPVPIAALAPAVRVVDSAVLPLPRVLRMLTVAPRLLSAVTIVAAQQLHAALLAPGTWIVAQTRPSVTAILSVPQRANMEVTCASKMPIAVLDTRFVRPSTSAPQEFSADVAAIPLAMRMPIAVSPNQRAKVAPAFNNIWQEPLKSSAYLQGVPVWKKICGNTTIFVVRQSDDVSRRN